MASNNSSRSTPDPSIRVIHCRNIGLVKEVDRAVLTQLDARILACVDPIPAAGARVRPVTVDCVGCSIRYSQPVDVNSIVCVVADRVSGNAGARAPSYLNPITPVVYN